MSARQVLYGWARPLLVIAGVATGVAMIVAITTINAGVLAHFKNTIDLLAGPAQLEVTFGAGEIGFSEAVVAAVRANSGVQSAIPLVRGTVSLADDPERTLQLFGVDFFADQDLNRYQIETTTDRREITRSIGNPNAILLTSRLARELRSEVGDSISLATPSGVSELKVVGLLADEGLAMAFGGLMAVMDLPAAQILLGKGTNIDQVDVIVRDGVAVSTVAESLRATLPATLRVGRPEQRASYYEKTVRSFQTMLTGLSALCLIAAVFIIYNSTSTAALQRVPAMVRLRVMGADGRKLFVLLMLEAAVLAVLGVTTGIVLGAGLAQLLTPLVTESMGVIFQLRFQTTPLELTAQNQLLAGTAGISAALFASYFAARHVAVVEPLAVLRNEHQEALRSVSTRRFVSYWVALVSICIVALVAEVRFGSITLGNIGATLWNASAIVIAVPMIAWSAPWLRRVISRIFGPAGRVAIESLSRSVKRAGITVAAISLVMTVGIFVSSLALSFRQSMRAYIGQFLAADLTVSAVTTEGGWLEIPLPETLQQQLERIPHVSRVDAISVLTGQPYGHLRISVGGLTDGFFDRSRYPDRWFKEGDPKEALASVREGTGANISTGLADRAGLHVGDTLTLDTPSGKLDLPVVGVVPDYASDKGTVIINRNLLKRFWRIHTVHRFFVMADASTSIADIRSSIEHSLGRQHRIKVLSLADVLAYHDGKINSAFRFTAAIQILVILVTIGGVFDLLAASILERRRELAVWRLIGAEEHTIRTSMVVESMTIGLLGIALGVAVGYVTAWIWININFRYLLGYYLETHFSLASVLGYSVLVMVTTIATSHLTARTATRADLLLDLQDE